MMDEGSPISLALTSRFWGWALRAVDMAGMRPSERSFLAPARRASARAVAFKGTDFMVLKWLAAPGLPKLVRRL